MSFLEDELTSLGVNLYDLEDLLVSQTIVGVLYGPTGAGKSRQFDTLPPKTGFYANFERGERSVIGTKSGKGVTLVSLSQFAKILVGLRKDLLAGECPYQYLFVDSATDMYKKEIARQAAESAADPSNNQKDADVPSQRDYMKVGKRVDKVINYAKDTPLTVIFTALEQPMMDDQNIARIAPAMSPAVRDSFMMYSDFVIYQQALSDGRRVALTQQSGKYLAKCRLPVGKEIPTRILNPNLYDIIRAIRGEEVKFETP